MLFRSGSVQEGSYWTVAKFVKDHSCQLELFSNCSRQVPAKVVSTMIVDKLLGQGHVIRPVDVIGKIKSTYSMEILYSKTWKAREYTQNLVYGHLLDYFQMLQSYFYMLEQKNPRTVKKLQVDKDNRFEFCFMAFGVCISCFRTCCRPAIDIDGTHLKGKYKGFCLSL